MKKNKLVLSVAAAALMSFSAQAHEHEHHHMHHQGSHTQVEFSGHETELSGVEFNRCWVRLVPGGRPSAAYFDLKNNGDTAISLIGARADNFTHVELHQTTVVDGKSMMGPLEQVLVEPGQSATFKPKANHVMLTAESEDAVAVGDTVTLQFKFEGEQVASAECTVKAINALSFDD
ncbi:MAG: copper chaperone PCu(A)C [Alcaligenaceae bacterium]|nr:copper chaperone PCu(A)C [Alcaligenaceae bacterium]